MARLLVDENSECWVDGDILEALKFYADAKNYLPLGLITEALAAGQTQVTINTDDMPVIVDSGTLAREILDTLEDIPNGEASN